MSRLVVGVVLGLYFVGWTFFFLLALSGGLEGTWLAFLIYIVMGAVGALVLVGVMRAIVWLARWITRP